MSDTPNFRTPADDARHRVVEAVHEVRQLSHSSGQADLDLYLALLQDRLPVYVSTLSELLQRVGEGSVHRTLAGATLATMDFYDEVLIPKVSVVAKPALLTMLRHVMRSRDLSPRRAEESLAEYLGQEQKLGRVAGDVEPMISARILVSSSLYYAFSTVLEGGALPSREEYADDIVRGLRLAPAG
jgi:hypothetical protein